MAQYSLTSHDKQMLQLVILEKELGLPDSFPSNRATERKDWLVWSVSCNVFRLLTSSSVSAVAGLHGLGELI